MAGEYKKTQQQALIVAKNKLAANELPMDYKSRMNRAKKMKFEDKIFYHGTGGNFDKFLTKSEWSTASGEPAAFFTDNPAVAGSYLPGNYVKSDAPSAIEYGAVPMGGNVSRYYSEGSNVIPVRIRDMHKFDVWDMGGGRHDPIFMKKAIREAKKNKVPGVVFENIKDPGYMTASSNPEGSPLQPSTVVAVFNPNLIRSQFANFDPTQKANPDITKARGGMTTDPMKAARAALYVLRRTFGEGGIALEGFAGGGATDDDYFTAYHGTPHTFEPEPDAPYGRFRDTAIGSGEGAQAYGHGHYLAGNEGVAKDYKTRLSNVETIFPTKKYKESFDLLPQRVKDNVNSILDMNKDIKSWSKEKPYDVHKTLESILDSANRGASNFNDKEIESIKNNIPNLLLSKKRPTRQYMGHLLQVRVRAKPEHFLDWDKPLSEQHPHVQKALEKFGFKADPAAMRAHDDALLAALHGTGHESAIPRRPEDPTGRDIHRKLVGGASEWGESRQGAIDTAKDLRAAGIPGIRYLDAGSRHIQNEPTIKKLPPDSFGREHWEVNPGYAGGAKWFTSEQEAVKHFSSLPRSSHNYVVFDPKDIDIMKRYAQGGEVYHGHAPGHRVESAVDRALYMTRGGYAGGGPISAGGGPINFAPAAGAFAGLSSSELPRLSDATIGKILAFHDTATGGNIIPLDTTYHGPAIKAPTFDPSLYNLPPDVVGTAKDVLAGYYGGAGREGVEPSGPSGGIGKGVDLGAQTLGGGWGGSGAPDPMAQARGGRIHRADGGDAIKNALNLTKPQEPPTLEHWIPTRKITSKKVEQDPRAVVDLPSFKESSVFGKNTDLVREYPNFVSRFAGEKYSPDSVSERFINHVVDNLLNLHDAVPENIRNRSKLWYDGANVIVNDIAKEYGIPVQGVAAAMAALSPQRDWFQNVSLGQRVIHAIKGSDNFYHGFSYTPEMENTLQATESLNKEQYNGIHGLIRGKTLGDIDRLKLPEDEKAVAKAMWVRLYDETHNPTSYRIVTPEGGFGDTAKTQDGNEEKRSWGSLTEIAKAIRALDAGNDTSLISNLMGERHKIRNFYNNILYPNSPHGDVTADTHAVAAALFRPLSGNSLEVAHNFASYPGKGLPSAGGSAIHGIQGTYPLYAEAYRRAAAMRGILPREMQSIAWEAIRGLFPDTFKRNKKNIQNIDNIWNEYRRGKISQQQAREQVYEAAGAKNGIRPPEWFMEGASGPHEENGSPAHSRELSGLGLRGPQTGASVGGTGDGPPASIPQIPDKPVGGFRRGGSVVDHALSLTRHTALHGMQHKRGRP